MATAVLHIEGGVTGRPGGGSGIDLTVDFTAAIGDRRNTDLANGANTITVPTGSTMCVFVPPSTNTQTLTLKGISGDTGIAMAVNKPALIPLSSVASFVITTNGAVTGCEFIFL